MIDYAKIILPKVSFSRDLFRKELVKCIGWSKPSEIDELKDWCFKSFDQQFADILEEVFSGLAA